jgi:hypothetical protein
MVKGNVRGFVLSLVLVSSVLVADAQINIDPSSRSFTKDGGGAAIIVSGLGSWNATTTASWITITPRTSGNAGESCIYVVSANLSADARQGTIIINDKTHTVFQSGYAATLNPTVEHFDLNGGTRTVQLSTSAGVSWTATASDTWITVNMVSGVGSSSVGYTVAPRSGVASRTGSILIGGQALTITQTGQSTALNPEDTRIGTDAGIVVVEVSAQFTTTWTVSVSNSWLSVVDQGGARDRDKLLSG